MSHFNMKDFYVQKSQDGFWISLYGLLDDPDLLLQDARDQDGRALESEIYMYMDPARDVNRCSGRVMRIHAETLPEELRVFSDRGLEILLSEKQLLTALVQHPVLYWIRQTGVQDGVLKIAGAVFAGSDREVNVFLQEAEQENEEEPGKTVSEKTAAPESENGNSADALMEKEDLSEKEEIRQTGLAKKPGHGTYGETIARHPDPQTALHFLAPDELNAGFELSVPAEQTENLFLVLQPAGTDDFVQIPLSDLSASDHRTRLKEMVSRSRDYIGRHGLPAAVKKAGIKAKESISPVSYHNWFLQNSPSDSILERQKRTKFEYRPVISIVLAAYNTPIELLKQTIESVEDQTYSGWQLNIADGSDSDEVIRFLQENYSDHPKIRFRKLDENRGIAGNMNEALSMADGDYISFFDHDDLLAPDCLYEIVRVLQNRKFDMIYTDEDKFISETGVHTEPHFKPNFSLDLLRSENYITHFLTVSAGLASHLNGFDSAYEGSQDYDYILRAAEKAESIAHIPRVLYHWRIHEGSTAGNSESKMYCFENGKKALDHHLARCQAAAHAEMLPAPYYGKYRIRYELSEKPFISIIIPVSGKDSGLLTLLESLEKISPDTRIQVLLAGNPETVSELELPEKEIQEALDLKLVRLPETGSVPEALNQAVSFAEGDLVLFLNENLSVSEPDSLYEMASLAMQPHIGAVCGRILNPKGMNAGFGQVIRKNSGRLLASAFDGLEDVSPGYQGRKLVVSDFSALDQNCLMITRDQFVRAGGFSEKYRVDGYAADLCLRLLQRGKYNAAVPFAVFQGKIPALSLRERELARADLERLTCSLPAVYDRFDPFYSPAFENGKKTFAVPAL